MNAANDHMNGRLPGLDALRLVAALAVVAFHWLYRGSVDGGYIDVRFDAGFWAELGYLGVNLFFLISGYVIASSTRGRSMPAFALARFARLYPGHVACMTITFVVLWWAAIPTMPVSGTQWLANLTMFAPAFGQPFMDGVYWSIVLELIFYGWMALAVAAGILDRQGPRIVFIWLSICALNEFMIQSGSMRLLFLTEYGPLFAFGMIARHWREVEQSALVLLLGLAAFFLSCNTLAVTQNWMLVTYGQAPGFGTLLIANAAIHATFLAALAWGDRLGSARLWANIGAVTYAIYLLHQYVGYAILERAESLVGKWPALVLAGLVVVALSVTVATWIEKPAGQAIRRSCTRFLERFQGFPTRAANPHHTQ